MRIDAHHHLWAYDAAAYPWITPEMAALRRDFLPGELAAVLRASSVDGTVAVQARQTVAETAWLLDFAEQPSSPVLGVVGWLPLAADDLPQQLASFSTRPLLKGLRHVVQAEPPGFLDDPAFNRGIGALQGTGLVYDLLVIADQLPEAIAFVDRHPAQTFVLDHLAKPKIRAGELEPWSRQLRALAERPHVICKLSGMVTEADPAHWTPEQLAPYAEVALEAFGPQRVMIGTDWPVLTLGCGYGEWWNLVEGWTASLRPDEQQAILGGTAQRIYQLAEQHGHAPVNLLQRTNG